MNVIGVIGSSNSGKTTLIEGLVGWLQARGLRVAVVKHAHDGFDIDRPGKDSYRYRDAGAPQVLIVTRGRWALLSETPAAPVPLGDLLARLDPCDLVLVEGFRAEGAFPRIEVRRGGVPPRPDLASDPRLVAIAADFAVDSPLPRLDLGDVAMIGRFVAGHFGLALAEGST